MCFPLWLLAQICVLMSDHDRPLSKAGRADAISVSNKLQQMGWIPELILCRCVTNSNLCKTVNQLSWVITIYQYKLWKLHGAISLCYLTEWFCIFFGFILLLQILLYLFSFLTFLSWKVNIGIVSLYWLSFYIRLPPSASFVLLFFLSLYFPIGTVILHLHMYILVFLCLCLVKYIVAPIPFLVPCPCLRGMTLQRLFYYSSSCLSGHSCNWCF
jgi:hypothetical protein